jgi:hypothetical protein
MRGLFKGRTGVPELSEQVPNCAERPKFARRHNSSTEKLGCRNSRRGKNARLNGHKRALLTCNHSSDQAENPFLKRGFIPLILPDAFPKCVRISRPCGISAIIGMHQFCGKEATCHFQSDGAINSTAGAASSLKCSIRSRNNYARDSAPRVARWLARRQPSATSAARAQRTPSRRQAARSAAGCRKLRRSPMP